MATPKFKNVIPTLRYEDAPAAIDWLCKAFQFEKGLVVPSGDGAIGHAQLRVGDDMIMLSSMGIDTAFDELMVLPRDVGGRETVSSYVIVEDVDAHHEVASAAGAEIVLPPVDQDYGGRGYTCRDLEGHLWSFGSYDPFSE